MILSPCPECWQKILEDLRSTTRVAFKQMMKPCWPCPKCEDNRTVLIHVGGGARDEIKYQCSQCGHVFTFEQGLAKGIEMRGSRIYARPRDGTYRPRKNKRQIGQVVGGYTVVGLNGYKTMWQRGDHFIVDYGSRRLKSTFDENEAKEVLDREE